MTYTILVLVRAAMALPYAPKVPTERHQCLYVGERVICFRGPDGIRWIDVAGENAGGTGLAEPDWLPDVNDPATGGVLVSMLGFEARRVRPTASMHKYTAGLWWIAEIPYCVTNCETQAEAACRVAVDIGGWK